MISKQCLCLLHPQRAAAPLSLAPCIEVLPAPKGQERLRKLTAAQTVSTCRLCSDRQWLGLGEHLASAHAQDPCRYCGSGSKHLCNSLLHFDNPTNTLVGCHHCCPTGSQGPGRHHQAREGERVPHRLCHQAQRGQGILVSRPAVLHVSDSIPTCPSG